MKYQGSETVAYQEAAVAFKTEREEGKRESEGER